MPVVPCRSTVRRRQWWRCADAPRDYGSLCAPVLLLQGLRRWSNDPSYKERSPMQHGYGARVAVVMATVLWVLGLWPAGAPAQSIVLPRDMLALSGTVNPGATTSLVPVGSSPAQAFVVPSGKVLILTDIIIAPPVFPVVNAGDYLLQVTPSP